MSEWEIDPFSNPEPDPEFGLNPLPSGGLFGFYLKSSGSHRSSLESVRAAGLRQRVSMAQRELKALHLRERHQLLLDAARIQLDFAVGPNRRELAAALWSAELPDLKLWRARCHTELQSSRRTCRSACSYLRRLLQREVALWPAASVLLRVADRLVARSATRLEEARIRCLESTRPALTEELGQLWNQTTLSAGTRLELLRTLAVAHEADGELQRATRVWQLVLGRNPRSVLARVSRFVLAVHREEEPAAREESLRLARLLDRSPRLADHLVPVLLDRARLSRAVGLEVSPGARELRLELLTSGDALLTQLCLELS